jgi:hypothetical protein
VLPQFTHSDSIHVLHGSTSPFGLGGLDLGRRRRLAS